MNENGKMLFLDPTDTSPVTEAPLDTVTDVPAEEALSALVTLLRAEGFNPVTQLSGYLITEDPTYLPEDVTARALARRVGRDKLLETLIELYIAATETTP